MSELTPQEYDFILRNDLMSFVTRVFYELNPQAQLIMASYLELIASKLEACDRGEIKRLIICMPPRQLKSICVTVAFSAWYLGRHPEKNIICASYGQELSEKFGRDCRSIMQQPWYQRAFPEARLSDRQALHDFVTTKNGGRFSTSVGGVLTGRGADMIILDDPLKPQDALSESQRTKPNHWYDNTLLSRLNNKDDGVIILVMQRLHQDDLVGHVLAQGNWDMLSLPAIAIEDEQFTIQNCFGTKQYIRKAGDLLNPARESLSSLNTMRAAIGEYDFLSQYQQTPIPQGGSIIKTEWLQSYETAPTRMEISQIIQSWDTAFKDTEQSNYSVCTTWAAFKGNYYLLDVLRKRLQYPDLKNAVKEQYGKHRPHKLIIEDKASGSSLIDDLKRDGILGIIAHTPPHGMDKRMRLEMQSDLFSDQKIYLPKNASWLDEYRTELIGFPGTKYNDQVDSTSQALEYFKNKYSSTLAIWEKLGR